MPYYDNWVLLVSTFLSFWPHPGLWTRGVRLDSNNLGVLQLTSGVLRRWSNLILLKHTHSLAGYPGLNAVLSCRGRLFLYTYCFTMHTIAVLKAMCCCNCMHVLQAEKRAVQCDFHRWATLGGSWLLNLHSSLLSRKLAAAIVTRAILTSTKPSYRTGFMYGCSLDWNRWSSTCPHALWRNVQQLHLPIKSSINFCRLFNCHEVICFTVVKAFYWLHSWSHCISKAEC